MTVSIDSEGRVRRKNVNADLLLVPYIDLLTCMVAFLLITAVWTQLARLEVAQRGQGDSSTGEPPQTKIAVVVQEAGFSVIIDDDQHPLGRQGGDLDFDAIGAELRRLKEVHPDKTDLQVLSEDSIKFDVLVKTMDQAMGAGFPNISLLYAATSAP